LNKRINLNPVQRVLIPDVQVLDVYPEMREQVVANIAADSKFIGNIYHTDAERWHEKTIELPDGIDASCWVTSRINIVTYDPMYLKQENCNDPQLFDQYANIELCGFVDHDAWMNGAIAVPYSQTVHAPDIETCVCYYNMLGTIVGLILADPKFEGAVLKDTDEE